ARDIEVREVVVLLFDLEEAFREAAILLLEGAEALESVLALALQRVDALDPLLAQPIPLLRILRGVVPAPLDPQQLATQPCVLLDELPGELGATPEHREEFARAFEQVAVSLAHSTLLGSAGCKLERLDSIVGA